jgi:hypothetical protein
MTKPIPTSLRRLVEWISRNPIRGCAGSEVVADDRLALASGDVEAIGTPSERDGYAREPAGDITSVEARTICAPSRRGCSRVTAASRWSTARSSTTRARVRAECNVVRWGKTELSPAQEVALYVRCQSGKLAAARIYDQVSPPLERRV